MGKARGGSGINQEQGGQNMLITEPCQAALPSLSSDSTSIAACITLRLHYSIMVYSIMVYAYITE